MALNGGWVHHSKGSFTLMDGKPLCPMGDEDFV